MAEDEQPEVLGDASETAASKIKIGGQLLYAGGAAVVAGFVCFMMYSINKKTSGILWWKKDVEIPYAERAPYLTAATILFIVAAIAVIMGLWLITGGRRKQTKPEPHSPVLTHYESILKGVDEISVANLASITAQKPERVRRDVTRLVKAGLLSGIYLDNQSDAVVNKRYLPSLSRTTVVTCSGCGSRNAVLTGVPERCDSCNEWLFIP